MRRHDQPMSVKLLLSVRFKKRVKPLYDSGDGINPIENKQSVVGFLKGWTTKKRRDIGRISPIFVYNPPLCEICIEE